MKIIRHIQNVPKEIHNGVYAIGNFDGIHRGHQYLINQTKEIAKANNYPSGVITFEPHTLQFFNPTLPAFRLTTFRSKVNLILDYNIDTLVALPFDNAIAQLSPDEFIENLLVKNLRIKHLVVGDNFFFGRKKSGNAAYLKEAGKALNFGVTIADVININDTPCSSNRIREALKDGNPRKAACLLGHWWTINGRVIHGEKLGRTIGFPTANLDLHEYLRPRPGIYAVNVAIDEDPSGTVFTGAAYFGNRPTVNGKGLLLEVYLFNFNDDLYDKHLRIYFLEYIRDDMQFSSLEDLKKANIKGL